MLEPKFSLKRKESATPTRIIVRIYYGAKNPFKYYLPISILPSKWDFKNKIVKKTAFNKESSKVNNYLNSISSLVRSYSVDQLELRKPITKESLKNLFDKFVKKTKTERLTLIRFIDNFILSQQTKVGGDRIKRYKNFKKHYLNFCKFQGFEYDFNDIDFDFYDALTEYLFNELQLAPNTVNGLIAILKSIMNEAKKKKLHSNLDFQDFTKPSSKVTRVYLNDSEIIKIWNTSVNDRLQKAKEVFIFACLTGLRFSDFQNVKPHNIEEKNGVHFLKITTKKTKEPVVIPIKPIAIEILEKHDYVIPKISNQKLNKYVKELLEIAEINDEIMKPIFKGATSEDILFKKFELISSHTGRRSFCTNAFLAGVPTLSIMMMSGHTTETSFMKYICVTKEQNANIISNHDFFKS